ncbi:YiaA/YiaB family inner membrane protein, partial [Streptomyces sp. NPDC001215]
EEVRNRLAAEAGDIEAMSVLGATAVGMVRSLADARVRAFLGIAVLYLVTSAFTLAKVIRDRQDAG